MCVCVVVLGWVGELISILLARYLDHHSDAVENSTKIQTEEHKPQFSTAVNDSVQVWKHIIRFPLLKLKL